MTVDEGQKVIEQFEAEGKSKEEIAGAFYLLFRDGKIDINGLEGLVNLLGYQLDDKFKAMSTEDQKQYGYELIDDEDQDNQGGDESDSNEDDVDNSDEEDNNDQDEDEDEDAGAKYFGEGNSKSEDEDEDEEEKEARRLLKY